MLCLATGQPHDTSGLGDIQITVPGGAAPIRSKGNKDLENARMDSDLKMLIAWCLANDPTDGPSIEAAYDIIAAAVRDRDEAFYYDFPDLSSNETDLAVDGFIQDVVLDPPSDDDIDVM